MYSLAYIYQHIVFDRYKVMRTTAQRILLKPVRDQTVSLISAGKQVATVTVAPPSRDRPVVFARWRLYVPHLIHGSLGSRESDFQTASRSVQPFFHNHPCDRHTDRQTDRQTDKYMRRNSRHQGLLAVLPTPA